MDNYIALLLLVVPGFISREVYGYLTDIQPVKDNFKETTYSLIFSAVNILGIYAIMSLVAWDDGTAELLTKSNIVESFNNPKLVAFYAVMAFLSSILIALLWKKAYPFYIWIVNKLRIKDGKCELSVSDSVFHDSFNDGKYHWVEMYKDDKFLQRGFLLRMDKENGEYYLLNAEENFKNFEGSLGEFNKFKGVYFDVKNNIVIKDVFSVDHYVQAGIKRP